ncbi:hypothetical protein PHYPO_G00167850 [Pangasianodon hypophthalmus]|uniref:Uncharacterized protein n=1 Tax=Pangasianodon hypophthalmus TaxID=310915 RepID=A0A5N5JHH5_PANHP|nr:hypothetical protein PHYPO_G00167850 [Pangasianodon hypophthalmus]
MVFCHIASRIISIIRRSAVRAVLFIVCDGGDDMDQEVTVRSIQMDWSFRRPSHSPSLTGSWNHNDQNGPISRKSLGH